MDREHPHSDGGLLGSNSPEGHRSGYSSVDWSRSGFFEPLTIYCSAEAAPRIRAMLYDAYVTNYGCPPELAREYIYGPPPPDPYRPDPVRVALLVGEVPARDALREMAHSLAESVLVIGQVGSSCATGIREISRLLVEQQETLAKAKLDQNYFDDYQSLNLRDFSVACPSVALAVERMLPAEVKPQKQRGKGRRGHNSDRDRVIGGKAGYC